MGTLARTRHAKCVAMSRICAYLISKPKSGTVTFAWYPKAFVSSSVLQATLNVLNDTRAIRLACDKTRVRYGLACNMIRVQYE